MYGVFRVETSDVVFTSALLFYRGWGNDSRSTAGAKIGLQDRRHTGKARKTTLALV